MEVLSRAGISLTLAGTEFKVRPRSIKANRDWQGKVRTALGSKFDALDDANGIDELYAYVAGSGDLLTDLVIEYDETNALPDRAWIEDNASAHEVLEAFMVLLEQSFPFFEIGRRFLPAEMRSVIIGRLIAAVISSASRPSTSAPSPRGASTIRPHSKKA